MANRATVVGIVPRAANHWGGIEPVLLMIPSGYQVASSCFTPLYTWNVAGVDLFRCPLPVGWRVDSEEKKTGRDYRIIKRNSLKSGSLQEILQRVGGCELRRTIKGRWFN
jgi:hypothetical protein